MTRPTPEQIAQQNDVEPADVCCCPDDFKDGMKRGAREAFRAVAKELRKHRDIINGISVEELDKILKELDGEKVTK